MDILLEWNPATYKGDFVVSAGGLAISQTGSDDLRSAVLVSLFSDARAPSDYVFPSQSDTDPRGWWGDTYEPSPIGSLLWTLQRSKNTSLTNLPRLAQTYCQQALQWLIDEGVVASITVRTQFQAGGRLAIAVTIIKPNGQNFPFAWVWAGF